MKFCSYNFVLKEAPNYNDATCVKNNYVVEGGVLQHYTMRVANNVCLTTMGARQFSMVAI